MQLADDNTFNKLEEEVKQLKGTDETLVDKSQETLDVQYVQDEIDKENNSVDILA